MGAAWFSKRKVLSTTGILLMFPIFMLCSLPSSVVALEPDETHQANALWIEPSTVFLEAVGVRFNLTVWLNTTGESFAWQLKILFDSDYFNATRLGYTSGEKSDFFFDHSTIVITPIVENDEGYVLLGETLIGNDTRGSGCGSLVWVEFSLKALSTEPHFNISCSMPYGEDTFVLNPYLETITLQYVSGTTISIASGNLIRDLLIIAAVIGIAMIVIIGIVKRRRSGKDE
ncbi:MAG: hypothetical protein BV458_13385 [Thermoplasmata archaeon M9B2D]|nr:MAG: hypothetical protein BV458_13385 [Thermoplasmata archaeon M9B2D]